MDIFCIDRGTLMDSGDTITTLEQPDQHSVHCMVDIEVCRDSGFEVLLDPLSANDLYCRGYRLDATGNDLAIAFAREHGDCDTCDADSASECRQPRRVVTAASIAAAAE